MAIRKSENLERCRLQVSRVVGVDMGVSQQNPNGFCYPFELSTVTVNDFQNCIALQL